MYWHRYPGAILNAPPSMEPPGGTKNADTAQAVGVAKELASPKGQKTLSF